MAAKKSKQDAADKAEEIEDMVGDYIDEAESWIERQLLVTRERAREEPITMLAVAAGIGALIGAIFLR